MSTPAPRGLTRRRLISALTIAAAAGPAAAACGTAAGGARRTATLRYQGWTGQVILPELAADLGHLGDVRLKWVGNTISGPQDVQSAATGQVDFGGAFNGAIVKLQEAGAPITSVIGYYGTDDRYYNGFFVLDDSPIKSPRDLIGKKIGMNTLGGHSQAVLDLYLRRNGLSSADIAKVEPLAVPPVTTEESLRRGQIDVAALSGIFQDKAVAAGGIRPLFKDHDFLGSFTAGSYVFRDDFIKRNPDTVRAFTAGVARTIEWSRGRPRAEVVARLTKILQARGRNENADALKYWKSWGVAEKGGVLTDREFDTWRTWLEDVGQIPKGRVKTADLYTNRFNPYRQGGSGR
ncbi:ABC transporter substrate-binding protein [Actinomadura chibensis]|uniref:PhnD/SsuA/transferrin family substrate-binding protein n=1 Tax=Actinomadura chibensis TaxID=392828 RepID=A0A5D0NR87_9ACTN|nr:ABC transporter substrate-binding protein [Actinomadura chibensis]TYB46648.1 PhnD/SsuA/transferrin family substrate-binding protein [Actinomadura chibensis]